MTASLLRNATVHAASTLRRPFLASPGGIVLQHRVVPESDRAKRPSNRVRAITTDNWRAMLAWVRRHGLEPIARESLSRVNAVDEREFQIVHGVGLATMFSTRPAHLLPESAGALDRLPRLGPSGNFAAVKSMFMRKNGLSLFLQERAQKRRAPLADHPNRGLFPV